jgi:type I restriction enzyme S subunit
MEKHYKYKDSGVKWLGEIPEHWEVKRIKDVGVVENGFAFKSNSFEKQGIRVIKIANIQPMNIDFSDKSFVNDSWYNELKGFRIYKGDIVFALTRPIISTGIKVAVVNSKERLLLNQRNAVFRPKRNMLNEYFYFILLSGSFIDSFDNFIDKTGTQPNISANKISWINVQLPPINEQTQIANYLDAKTTAIDKKVNLLQQKIKHYKAYRKTLINETVTKGLDKTVKLKYSGINWIGEIPEHWEVKRYKSFGKTIKGKNMEMSDLEFDNSLPLLSLEYLRNDSVKHPTFCYSKDKSLKSTDEDLVIVWDGAAVGEILKSKVGYVSSTIAKLDINKKKFNTRYFYHLRGAIDYKLKQIPTGMGIPHLNPTLFKNFKCPSPPIEEQRQISEYLDTKTATIDSIVKNIKTQITTLKELRKALINEVVTGKVKVSA